MWYICSLDVDVFNYNNYSKFSTCIHGVTVWLLRQLMES